MALNGYSWIANLLSFVPGLRLIDGGDLLQLANLSVSAKSGITALAGGGQIIGAGNSNVCSAYISEVSVVATANDSVILPVGIPGTEVTIINDGANSLQVFGQPTNATTGVGETIAAHGSTAQTATATGVALPSANTGVFSCFAPGKWKQQLST
jgi:hypothetical protein